MGPSRLIQETAFGSPCHADGAWSLGPAPLFYEMAILTLASRTDARSLGVAIGPAPVITCDHHSRGSHPTSE
jgi:hypothetical protein